MIKALITLRDLAHANPAEVPALVLRLENEAAEYVLTVRENLDDAPAIILRRLVERFPLLATLQLHPDAEAVINSIVTVLRQGEKK